MRRMTQALAVLYLALVVLLFACAIHWARKKKREFKNPSTRHRVTTTAEFFVKDLPRGWYVSVQFCIGFALSAFVAVVLYKVFLQYWK
jgi:hypothetical protein